MNDPCPLCGDPLGDGEEEAHEGCLDEWQTQIEARTCYVCGDPLDDDQPDNAVHPGCLDDRWLVGTDPFLLVEDTELP